MEKETYQQYSQFNVSGIEEHFQLPTPPVTPFFLRTLEFQRARQSFLLAEIFSHQIGTHFHFVLAVPMIRGNNISREGTRQQIFAFGLLGGEACSDNHKGLSLLNRRQDISTAID
jgi:hypothetical protein